MANSIINEAERLVMEYANPIDAQTVLEAVLYMLAAGAIMFTVKTVITAVARALGICHPGHYRYWPRLPWRGPYKVYIWLKNWQERVFKMKKGPTGGFAGTLSVMSNLYWPGMLLLGRVYALGLALIQPVGGKILRHCFIMAMTGAGKTTLLISQIRSWRGSCFVIDPKGQITRALQTHDKRKWHIFSPQKKYGFESACINVFDLLDELYQQGDEGAFVDWVVYIAEAIIPTPEGVKTPYFYETPCGFFVGLIVHVYTYHDKHDWNLPFVRDLIKYGYRVFDEDTGEEETTEAEAFALLLGAMRNNPAIGHIIPGAAAAFASAAKETLANLKSSIFTQTKWLDNPSTRKVLLKSTFDLRDLKRRDDVVFSFVAGILALKGPLAPLARFIISLTALVFEHFDEKNGQCLMVCDELPSMGNNKTIEVLLPVFRSYGISFVGISQAIQLLRSAYPKTWRSFLGNADFVIWMATNEDETKEYCSNTLGRKTLIEKDKYTGRKKSEVVKVLDAEQVGRLLSPESGRMIVTQAGKRAKILVNEPYHKALPVWAYAPDPDHGDTFLRRISRFLFDRKKPNNCSSGDDNSSSDLILDPEIDFNPQEIIHDNTSSNIIPFKRPGDANARSDTPSR